MFRGSGGRMAVYDLYYTDAGWNSVVLHGNSGHVSVQDLSGNEEAPDLYL